MLIPNPYEMISNLGSRDLENPEGAGFDLRAEQLFTLKRPEHRDPYLGVHERSTPDVAAVTPIQNRWLVNDRDFLVVTAEHVHLPETVIGLVWPRTTLFRSGALLQTGVVHPGYEGPLTFLLRGPRDGFIIEPLARIAHILFVPVAGVVNSYRGQWQGGRVSAPELESQT